MGRGILRKCMKSKVRLPAGAASTKLTIRMSRDIVANNATQAAQFPGSIYCSRRVFRLHLHWVSDRFCLIARLRDRHRKVSFIREDPQFRHNVASATWIINDGFAMGNSHGAGRDAYVAETLWVVLLVPAIERHGSSIVRIAFVRLSCMLYRAISFSTDAERTERSFHSAFLISA